jgi:hypothetical protein
MGWGCGVSLFDFFSFLLGVIVLGGGILPPEFRYVCVCVCVCVCVYGYQHTAGMTHLRMTKFIRYQHCNFGEAQAESALMMVCVNRNM